MRCQRGGHVDEPPHEDDPEQPDLDTPAGWYPDPVDPRKPRWWDGHAWSAKKRAQATSNVGRLVATVVGWSLLVALVAIAGVLLLFGICGDVLTIG